MSTEHTDDMYERWQRYRRGPWNETDVIPLGYDAGIQLLSRELFEKRVASDPDFAARWP